MQEFNNKTFCVKCNNKQFAIGMEGTVSTASPCDACFASCALCQNRRYTFVEQGGYSYAEPCKCQKLHDRIRLFNYARIPARYRDKLWLPLQGSEKYPLHDTQEKAINKMHDWVLKYTESAPGFLLMGPCGTGKTLFLCWVLGYLTLRINVPCRYVEFSLLLEEMREQVRRGGSAALKSPLRDVTVLAVDELGKIRGTDWELAELDSLITARYQAGKTTLFATNYTDNPRSTYQSGLSTFADRPRRVYTHNPFVPVVVGADNAEEEKDKEKRPSGPGDTLQNRVGTRIYSRLRETCEFIPVDGDDFRYLERERT